VLYYRVSFTWIILIEMSNYTSELAASLKQLLRGFVTEAEIDACLVAQFRQRRVD